MNLLALPFSRGAELSGFGLLPSTFLDSYLSRVLPPVKSGNTIFQLYV